MRRIETMKIMKMKNRRTKLRRIEAKRMRQNRRREMRIEAKRMGRKKKLSLTSQIAQFQLNPPSNRPIKYWFRG